MKTRVAKIALYTTAAMAAFFGVAGLLIYWANSVDQVFLSTRQQAKVSTFCVLSATIVCTLILIGMVASGFQQQLSGRERNPLYVPALAIFVSVTFVLIPFALIGLDLIAHDWHQEWMLAGESEIAVYRSIAFAILAVGGFGWFYEQLLGHGWSRKDVFAVFAGSVALIAVAILIVVIITS